MKPKRSVSLSHHFKKHRRRKGYNRPLHKREFVKTLREAHEASLPILNGGIMRIKLKEYYDRMEQAVSAILANTDVQEYFKKIALFRNYSFANTLLIVLQRPSATRVGGIVTWNKLGRRVKQGEKGIMIFAPMFARWTRRDEETEEGVTEDLVETNSGRMTSNKEATCLAGFKAVYVYDIAQTHGGPNVQRTQRLLGLRCGRGRRSRRALRKDQEREPGAGMFPHVVRNVQGILRRADR